MTCGSPQGVIRYDSYYLITKRWGCISLWGCYTSARRGIAASGTRLDLIAVKAREVRSNALQRSKPFSRSMINIRAARQAGYAQIPQASHYFQSSSPPSFCRAHLTLTHEKGRHPRGRLPEYNRCKLLHQARSSRYTEAQEAFYFRFSFSIQTS